MQIQRLYWVIWRHKHLEDRFIIPDRNNLLALDFHCHLSGIVISSIKIKISFKINWDWLRLKRRIHHAWALFECLVGAHFRQDDSGFREHLSAAAWNLLAAVCHRKGKDDFRGNFRHGQETVSAIRERDPRNGRRRECCVSQGTILRLYVSLLIRLEICIFSFIRWINNRSKAFRIRFINRHEPTNWIY